MLLAKLQLLAKTMSRSICVISKVLIIILSHFAQVNISVFFEKFLKKFICCGRKALRRDVFPSGKQFAAQIEVSFFPLLAVTQNFVKHLFGFKKLHFDSYLTRPVMHSKKKF